MFYRFCRLQPLLSVLIANVSWTFPNYFFYLSVLPSEGIYILALWVLKPL